MIGNGRNAAPGASRETAGDSLFNIPGLVSRNIVYYRVVCAPLVTTAYVLLSPPWLLCSPEFVGRTEKSVRTYVYIRLASRLSGSPGFLAELLLAGTTVGERGK